MLHLLDDALEALVRRRLQNQGVDVSFSAPDGDWSAAISRPTVNLFLWDIRPSSDGGAGIETLRTDDGQTVRRPTLPRIEFRYMVTAWATAGRDEHQLLGSLAAVLARHQEIEADLLADPIRIVRPLPSVVLATREAGDRADFWTALGGRYHAGLDIVVRATVDPGVVAPGRRHRRADAIELGLTDRREPERRSQRRRVTGSVADPAAVGAVVRTPERMRPVGRVATSWFPACRATSSWSRPRRTRRVTVPGSRAGRAGLIVRLSSITERLLINPGEPTPIVLEVFNDAAVIDGFVLEVLGLDAVLPNGEVLEPHRRHHPNRSCRSSPRRLGLITAIITFPTGYPSGLRVAEARVRSVSDPDEIGVERIEFDVAKVPAATITPVPQSMTGGRRAIFGLVVDNTGNVPLELDLTVTDAENVLVGPPGTERRAETEPASRAPTDPMPRAGRHRRGAPDPNRRPRSSSPSPRASGPTSASRSRHRARCSALRSPASSPSPPTRTRPPLPPLEAVGATFTQKPLIPRFVLTLLTLLLVLGLCGRVCCSPASTGPPTRSRPTTRPWPPSRTSSPRTTRAADAAATGGVIAGMVTDAAGNAIGDATVEAAGDGAASATTAHRRDRRRIRAHRTAGTGDVHHHRHQGRVRAPHRAVRVDREGPRGARRGPGDRAGHRVDHRHGQRRQREADPRCRGRSRSTARATGRRPPRRRRARSASTPSSASRSPRPTPSPSPLPASPA